MGAAIVIGHITVKDLARWADYRSRVPATLAPWHGEVVFRGRRTAVLGGAHARDEVVVLRFADPASADAWFRSPAYQSLIPLRLEAADVDLISYES
jgi:uncharacterized protein (DUF1330 family)